MCLTVIHRPSLQVPDDEASQFGEKHYLGTVLTSKHWQLSGWLPRREIVHQQRYRYIDRGKNVDFNIVCKMRFGNILHQVWAGNPNNSNSRAKIYYMHNTAYDKYKHRELLKMYPHFWGLYFAAELYRGNQFC